MKKRLQQLSVKAYTVFLLLFVLVLFLVLIVFNNHTAMSLLLKRIYENTQDTAVLYQKQIDSELDRIETYLYTVMIDNADCTNLIYREKDSAWYSSLYRLTQNFLSALSVYSADGFLFYLPSDDTFLFRYQVTAPDTSLRRALRRAVAEESHPNEWEILEVNNECYLLRVINFGKASLGAIVSVESLFNSIVDVDSENVDLYLSTSENRLFGGKTASVSLDFDVITDTYEIKTIGEQKVLVVQQKLTNGDLFLTRLVPYSEVEALSAGLNRDVFVTTALFLAVCLWLVYIVRKQIIRPVTNLTKALERVSEGDWENHISTSGQLKEYHQMSRTFNEMVAEIKNLKINIYEEKLSYQELENQYLKQQVTPHFMINCLNTAYQLTEPEYLDLARAMLMDLSRHLRYTLSSGKTVSLDEELKFAENYVEMSSIRYPGCLKLYANCPDAFRNAAVVPLLILNFIENTIKHEVVMGTVLEMHVEASSFEKDNGIWLHICVWDTGRGFPAGALEELKVFSHPSAEDTSHIGYSNIVFRMRRIFPDVSFKFCNRIGAGAQIDIEFPYKSYEGIAASGT